MTVAPVARATGRSRRLSFYVTSGVTVAFAVFALWPALIFPAVVWLPDSTLRSIFGEQVGIHRIHGAGFAILLWTIVLCVAVQLVRPGRGVAPIWLAVGGFWAAIVLDIVTGIFEPTILIFGVLILAIGLLHPASPLLARPRMAHRGTALAALPAAVPLALYGVSQLRAQLAGVEADPHVAAGHFTGMAQMAMIVILAAFLGASDAPGARITAWIAGVGMAFYGVTSIVFPDHVSSLGILWGIAAILWGAGYTAIAHTRRVTVPEEVTT